MSEADPGTSDGSRFPRTRLSLLEGLRSDERQVRRRCLDLVVAAYWRPVYAFIRIRYRQTVEDAQDLTQGFFTAALEKGFFESYDPSRSRFRTFLRVCLDRYVANQFQAAGRVKRGGEIMFQPLDVEGVERELQHSGAAASSIDDYFEREWVRSVLELAVNGLRKQSSDQGKAVAYAIFETYDLERDDSNRQITYQHLADRHNITVSAVTNHLADMRRQFRGIVLDTIRELTCSEEEFRREVRAMLGIEAP